MTGIRNIIHILLVLVCMSLGTKAVWADSIADTHARNAALADYAALHRMVADDKQPMMWLFVGDSITHGCLHTSGGRSFPEHWMEIAKWELETASGARRSNDIVINAAVSGETAGGFLKHAEWRLQQFRPSVVFINFGINDGTRNRGVEAYRKDLLQIIRLVREQGAIPILQTPSLTLAAEAYRPHYAAVVRGVADAQNVLLVDHTARWEEDAGHAGGSFAQPAVAVKAPRRLMNDNLHPNVYGHRLMVQTIAGCLGIKPTQSPTLQLPLR